MNTAREVLLPERWPSVRQARRDDADALFEAHQDAVHTLCAGAYSEAHLRAWFVGRSPEMYGAALDAGGIWLAESGGRVLGFVGVSPGEVTLLFVRGEAAGRGLGKRLFAFGMERAEVGFNGPMTVVATRNSQHFYQAFGFVVVEECWFIRGTPELEFPVVKMQRARIAGAT